MSNRTIEIHALNSAQLVVTKNDLDLEIRHHSIETLNSVVVHLIDLALACKHAHWNVRGPNFMSFHALFDKAFEELIEQIDILGERATALGGVARGTVQTVAGGTRLKPYPVFSVSEQEHIEQLAMRLGQLGRQIRVAATGADGRGDIVTADVLVQASAAVDSLLWRIESHAVPPIGTA